MSEQFEAEDLAGDLGDGVHGQQRDVNHVNDDYTVIRRRGASPSVRLITAVGAGHAAVMSGCGLR